jgi:hypothetical protein
LIKKVKEKELLDHIVPKNRSIPDMDFEEKTFELFGDDPFLHRRVPLGHDDIYSRFLIIFDMLENFQKVCFLVIII